MQHIHKIIVSPYKIKNLARDLSVHPSIVYGVYLENLSKDEQHNGFKKYGSFLIGSDTAIKPIMFAPTQTGNLKEAIKEIKDKLYNIKIA